MKIVNFDFLVVHPKAERTRNAAPRDSTSGYRSVEIGVLAQRHGGVQIVNEIPAAFG